MNLKDEIKSSLIESRNVILNGGVNCIPSPFTRFRSEFPGIRKKCYYLISGATKSAKTQLATFLFVINPIFYYIKYPDQVLPTIMYFPLEETKEDITLRFYSYVINYLTEGKIKISPEDLESVDERKPLPQEVLDIMDSEEFIKISNIFEERVIFYDDRNPTGVWRRVKTYLEEHGKTLYEEKDVTYTDDFGNVVNEKVKRFKEYIPDNPNEYIIPIVDHAGLLQEERGMTLKATIEKLSEYFVILRNKYKVSPVLIQQQNQESTNLEAFKANKIRPVKDGLKDSKRSGEDCTVMLGITNPHSFDLNEYLGYNIGRMKDSFRVLEIVLARKGKANGLCPLYFNGAVNEFLEIPLPSSPEIEKVYRYSEKVREEARKITSTPVMLLIAKINEIYNNIKEKLN